MSEDEVVDYGDATEVYADGISAVHIIQDIAIMYFFVWKEVDGVYRRKLCHVMRRPASSLGHTFQMAAQKQVPKTSLFEVPMH